MPCLEERKSEFKLAILRLILDLVSLSARAAELVNTYNSVSIIRPVLSESNELVQCSDDLVMIERKLEINFLMFNIN